MNENRTLAAITVEQQKQLEKTTLTSGKNAWAYVQEQREQDQYWTACGILSCIQKGYDLNLLTIGAETRNVRYGRVKNPIA